MRAPRLVTLTSDVGAAYAAQMKAVLLQRLPPGHIIDIAHDLPAHGIPEAAFLLRQIAPAFPSGTVHLVIVDPGVGGRRAPVAVACRDGSTLVGPDNGVLEPTARRLGVARVVRLDPQRVVPDRPVSATFEGRDLFAPAAARIATGTPLGRMGEPAALRALRLPEPRRTPRGVDGEVLHVDRFGNAVTNIPTAWWPEEGPLLLRIADRRRRAVRQRTYADLPPRQLGVLGSSFGTLEIAVREGRAADRGGLGVGRPVALRRSGRPAPARRRRAYGK